MLNRQNTRRGRARQIVTDIARRLSASPRLIAAVLIVIAVARLLPTCRTFSATADEATHVGSGLELYQFHQYRLQDANPPLARLVLAAVPALSGMRFDPRGTYGEQLHSVFYGGGKYEQNLFRARIGNLFFLVLGAVALFVWARREAGEREAVVAVFLFTFQPVVLGHAGLATNDAAATATLAIALIAFSRWRERPDLVHASMLGVAWAIAVFTKFSNIAFVPLACAGIFAVQLLRLGTAARLLMRRSVTLIAVPIVAAAVLWSCYAFTVGHVNHLADVKWSFGTAAERFIDSHPAAPLPAPAFFHGVGAVLAFDREGFDAYFFGQRGTNGWKLYFPAALAFKTTIAFLLLLIAGGWFAVRAPATRWPFIECSAAAAAILVLSTTSTLDLGVRYILPIYIPLTAAAGIAAVAMLRASARMRFMAIVLIASHGIASLAAHPDYFPYFNAFAGSDPSRYLIDSNLDWGQDALRLRKTLRELRVQRVGVALMGSADYAALGFPPAFAVGAWEPAAGWVAVSDHIYRMEGAQGGWRWLQGLPFRRIGKSIRLFNVPAGRAAISSERAVERDTTRITVLLPLAGTSRDVAAAGGARWRVLQTLQNTGATPMRIGTNGCLQSQWCDIDLGPGALHAIELPPRARYVWLKVPRTDIGHLRSSTVVERTDAGGGGFRTSLPAVPEDQFTESVVIRGVPVSPAAHLNLRAWLLHGDGPVQFSVTAMSSGQPIGERSFETDPNGAFTDSDFASRFEALNGRATIVDFMIESRAAQALPGWAFITSTDNRTAVPSFHWPERAR